MKHDILADMFSIVKNMEALGRPEATVPKSKVIENVLTLMQKHEYIKSFEPKSNSYVVKLGGRINACNVIRPRFSSKVTEYIKWEKRFLPANSVGLILLSTPKGVMDHHTAKKEGVGGSLLGYVY